MPRRIQCEAWTVVRTSGLSPAAQMDFPVPRNLYKLTNEMTRATGGLAGATVAMGARRVATEHAITR
jgi:hypothetical protein